MANVMDYIEWRGDLSFTACPLSEVDNLIFCLLSYVDLDGIVPATPKEGRVTVRQAAMEFFFDHDPDEARPLGLIVPTAILDLFRRMAWAPRYRDLELTGYVDEVCEEREMQFSALTVRLPDEQVFVAFRGTDDTIVGWREDFNLSYMDEIPSQRKAVRYLDALDLTPESRLYVGGHSKGGNLAVWSVIHADESIRHRVVRVFSNDGPGFSEELIASEAYGSMADRITCLLPDDSLVGLLLENDGQYEVVKSHKKGLFQHDGLSWEVMGGQFVRSEGLSPRGTHNDTVVRDRIRAMTREEKREFTHLFFGVLESTGAKTLKELNDGKIKAVLAALRTWGEMEKETKETALYLVGKLFDIKVLGAATRPSQTQEKPDAPSKRESRWKSRRESARRVRVEWFPGLDW